MKRRPRQPKKLVVKNKYGTYKYDFNVVPIYNKRTFFALRSLAAFCGQSYTGLLDSLLIVCGYKDCQHISIGIKKFKEHFFEQHVDLNKFYKEDN